MTDTPTPSLDDQMCFDLYAASRAVTNAYRPVLTRLGLTYPQYLVLIVMWERGTLTVRELGDALSLDHGTLTPLLRRMETAGLVIRQRSSSDERFVEVALTAAGDSLRQHGPGIHCDMKDAMGLTDDEFRALQQVLRLVTLRVSAT